MKKLQIFDSTLRDGAQGEGISYSVEDKIKIVRALDKLGVSFIEAGNPGSNPKELEFFERIRTFSMQNAQLVAFGPTRRHDMTAMEDRNCQALLSANTPVVSIFGKSWDMQVYEVLGTTLEQNLNMIEDTIAFFVRTGKKVIFDAEHYFSGYKENPVYALQTLKTAVNAGAICVTLCDTDGSCFPQEIFDITREAAKECPVDIGIHCHNDMGCAVANSFMAVSAGAVQVQGTLLGFGERCGNANLSAIIPSLQIKQGYLCIPQENMSRLTKTVRYVAEITNMVPDNALPYVGSSAFAHKGGMHVDGVHKNSRSFEHIPPETVGNHRKFLISEMSGKTAILKKIQEIDESITKDSPLTQQAIDTLKELELQGYQFESAGASLEVLLRKELGRFTPFFELEHFQTTNLHYAKGQSNPSSAIVKIRVGEQCEITAAEGDGPVHALDCALRKALEVFYPRVADVRLIDYKVRVMEPQNATAAQVRVLIETTDGESVWTTVGASTDIIDASWKALVDSIEYKLLKDEKGV